MAMTWDLTDVPTVEVADLAAVMRALIDDGRGLVLRRGISDEDMNAVHAEVQRRFHGEPQRALAVFVRFRNLVEVFSARRLKDMLMEHGFPMIAPALAIAASLRLNAQRGFNPQHFLMSLQDALTAAATTIETRREGAPGACAVAGGLSWSRHSELRILDHAVEAEALAALSVFRKVRSCGESSAQEKTAAMTVGPTVAPIPSLYLSELFSSRSTTAAINPARQSG